MAYTRRSTRRPTYRKKRTYRKKAPASFSSTALSALKGYGLKILKSKLGINTEYHWLDTQDISVTTTSTCSPMAYPLTIPQGDSPNQRQGATVRLTSYVCKIRIQPNTAGLIPCHVRVIFVKFSPTRGSSPTASFFLDSSTRTTSHYQMGDSANAIGYTILYDKTVTVPLYTAAEKVPDLTFSYTPLDHHLKWDSADTTGNASNLAEGFVRGYIFTSDTSANGPVYTADHRIKFVDN